MRIEYKDGTIINYFIMTRILEWCYTSTLDFEHLSIPDIIVVLKAAAELDIPHLHFICDQYIRSELTVDSSFIILKQASLLKMDDLKNLATQFAYAKWAQFTQHKGGMEIIGIELFQELTIGFTQLNGNGNDRKSVSMGNLKIVPNTLHSDFETIFKQSRFVDAELSNPTTENNFNFHKAILGAYSKQFFNLISQATSKTKQFTLEGLGDAAISDLLQFVYFNKTNLDPVGACQIVEHAMSQYSLHAIREAASNSIANGISCDNAISILRMTYLPQCKHRSMVRLRAIVLFFICENFTDVDIPSLRDLEHSHFGNNLMADVLDAFHNYETTDTRKPMFPSVSMATQDFAT